MRRETIVLAVIASAMLVYTAVVMPGCGGSNQSTATVAPSYYNCQPGTQCVNGIPTAQGIPLINSPSISFLSPAGPVGSYLALSYAAPTMVAGSLFNGPVNISGNLHLAPGDCAGPYYGGGDFQVQGQGQWISNYGMSIAGVSGSLQVIGGSQASYGFGGQVTFQTALLKDLVPPMSGYNYTLSYGPGVYVSFCNRLFAFYNF